MVRHGRCLEHARQADRERRKQAGHSLYDDKRWRSESKQFRANQNCADCGRPAECTDHREAHKGNAARFWDRSNWRPLCLACNSRKGIKQEGGFGR